MAVIIVCIIFIVIGFSIIALCSYRKKQYELCTEEVDAVIVSVCRQYINSSLFAHKGRYINPRNAIVEYEVDGVKYKSKSICGVEYNLKVREGKKIKVYYNPQNVNICVDEYARIEKIGMRKRDFFIGWFIVFFGAILLGMEILMKVN